MILPDNWDWRRPDYAPIFQRRAAMLAKLRAQPERLPAVRRYYRDHIADFIDDWGLTYDPRVVKRGIPATMPFILFPKQREWVGWFVERWEAGEPGITDKSRDLGMSWLSVAVCCSLSVFYDGFAAGFGSRKEEYVDKIGSPKSLFWKARQFIRLLPEEFRAGHVPGVHGPHLRLTFPLTGSVISGEAGDNIGRGDRAAVYVVDEAAYLERPQLIEASLSATTDCRIDISSANGMSNPFAVKRFSYPSRQVFTLHWRDDPRKDDEWYAKQVAQLDPVTVAQEIDINYAASVTGVVIPSAWVQAAIDSHVKLGLSVSGAKRLAADIADEGIDKNAVAASVGPVLTYLEEWSGKGSDTFFTTQRIFSTAESLGVDEFLYDADGIGASVRGDSRVVNETRREQDTASGRIRRAIRATPFRGSGSVDRPEAQDFPGRANEDYFYNLKAQNWGGLKRRFQETYRAINEPGYKFDPSLVVSIPSAPVGYAAERYTAAEWTALVRKLTAELSQPTWGPNTTGKMVVDKSPDGTRSPNLADSVMMLLGSTRRAMTISDEAVRAA